MALRYDPIKRSVHNNTGVDLIAPGFGETWPIEFLNPFLLKYIKPTDYMHPLVNSLAKLGLKRGHGIRAAPYDFRLAPRKRHSMHASGLMTLSYI